MTYIDQILRVIAVLCLAVASLCMLSMAGSENNLCLYEYIRPLQVTYFSELHGTSADDPEMIQFSGIVGLFLCLPLLLSYRRFWYILFLAVYFLIFLIVLSMLETAPFSKIIYDSIVYCHQPLWVIGVITWLLFLILSLIYVRPI